MLRAGEFVRDNFQLFNRAQHSEDNSEQIALCDQVLIRDPDHLPAIELKAKALWRSGRYPSALQCISQAIAINPKEPGYHFLRADCLQHLSRYGEAVREFEKCQASEDRQMVSEAEVRIAALEQIQHAIIAQLLASNPKFRGAYSENAENALARHGFAFAEKRADEGALVNKARAELWARPS